jgi:hypothetical protein
MEVKNAHSGLPVQAAVARMLAASAVAYQVNHSLAFGEPGFLSLPFSKRMSDHDDIAFAEVVQGRHHEPGKMRQVLLDICSVASHETGCFY